MNIMNQSIPIINHFSARVTIDSYSNNRKYIESLADNIIKKLDLTIVKKVYYSFKPVGETLVYILSESHFVIHTWPEYKLIHLDLVSCKLLTKEKVKNVITTSLNSNITYKIDIEENKI